MVVVKRSSSIECESARLPVSARVLKQVNTAHCVRRLGVHFFLFFFSFYVSRLSRGGRGLHLLRHRPCSRSSMDALVVALREGSQQMNMLTWHD